ncbi:hypothetical protein [Streptomyces sp. CB02400]|uniref:hypothetical protein n=1 Tax=Streptomyces sp. CB02400 TaxID=1703944 RepID=UPI00093B0C01|nr:hypothetical protein [Streptomyces sp. CB02400]OKK10322.1 hypothetical protein AMK33_15500 [Streptomyces sp. CB02400]
MSGSGTGAEAGARTARSHALAVLRVRSRALAVALLPAAVAVILLVGGSTGHLPGGGWDLARRLLTPVAVLVLLVAAGVALVVVRARPAMSPTVPIAEDAAPDLYRMVRDLADRLDVPAPSAIALTPDCDSWLEDRTHPAHGPPPAEEHGDIAGAGQPVRGRAAAAPVLVIGSPFLWWMRVGELRAVLAPVVAGTGPSAHPDIAAARRFVRGLDAAVAVSSAPRRGPVVRGVLAGVGRVARLLLRGCRGHAAEMERGVAAAAAERAQAVDYGLRIVAQEQVGLAYAGWDRLLTRVALPAWRMGRWPSRLNAGVVAALTELSRRDRLAEGFASRLGERPACDLLEEPGTVDEAASLLAARLFHGGPAETGPDWSPVHWGDYPEEVVDRKWRTDAARLHRVLDALHVPPAPDEPSAPGGPTLARVLTHLTTPPTRPTAPGPLTAPTDRDPSTKPPPPTESASPADPGPLTAPTSPTDRAPSTEPPPPGEPAPPMDPAPSTEPAPLTAAAQPTRSAPPTVPASPRDPASSESHPSGGSATPFTDRASSTEPIRPADPGPLTAPASPTDRGSSTEPSPPTEPAAPAEPAPPMDPAPSTEPGSPAGPVTDLGLSSAPDPDDEDLAGATTRSAALAVRLSAELAREETAGSSAAGAGTVPLRDDQALPLFPLQPPRTARELLADHIAAMVCCAAMDTAGATPGLDWLDGPTLILGGARATDLSSQVLVLIEDGDPSALRLWLTRQGIRPEKPVRLV